MAAHHQFGLGMAACISDCITNWIFGVAKLARCLASLHGFWERKALRIGCLPNFSMTLSALCWTASNGTPLSASNSANSLVVSMVAAPPKKSVVGAINAWPSFDKCKCCSKMPLHAMAVWSSIGATRWKGVPNSELKTASVSHAITWNPQSLLKAPKIAPGTGANEYSMPCVRTAISIHGIPPGVVWTRIDPACGVMTTGNQCLSTYSAEMVFLGSR